MWCEWDARADARPAPGSRVNHELAPEERDPLAHADEAKPALSEGLRIETDARIGHLKGQTVVPRREAHFRFLRAAVLGDVVERFLGDPIETERHVRIDFVRQRSMLEADGDPSVL